VNWRRLNLGVHDAGQGAGPPASWPGPGTPSRRGGRCRKRPIKSLSTRFPVSDEDSPVSAVDLDEEGFLLDFFRDGSECRS